VYETLIVPDETADTIPAELMVPIAGLLLVHIPPVIASLREVAAPTQVLL
jgi:hypothetical protein